MKRNEYKIDYDSYEYSPNIKNDTNIGFNGLELMSEMGVSSGGDALDNILYYTEWIGLRERNMLMNAANDGLDNVMDWEIPTDLPFGSGDSDTAASSAERWSI